jgi:hypothetical protein
VFTFYSRQGETANLLELVGRAEAAPALWLALAAQADIGAVALAAPDGPADAAFHEIKRPVLVLSGTQEGSDAGDRYRTLLPDCHFMFVYDAGRAPSAPSGRRRSRTSREFFERRDLFLVNRESGIAFPRVRSGKFRDRPPCAESSRSLDHGPSPGLSRCQGLG